MPTGTNAFEILTAHRFYLGLELDDSQDGIDGIFLECRGFQQTQEVIEVCEVTPQAWGSAGATQGRVVRTKMPGNVKSGNLTLRRGMTLSKTFWTWFHQVQEGNWAKQRKDASLVIYDQASAEVARFDFSRAWPTSYKFTDVSARSTDIEIEELEIAFEEFKRVS
ncbi:phage tail protein [Oculatella sp. LEGE 06141]|uniref:phage tail protein n=1 Tax=Oculatella sp. LEGE 06141 TaxID=1828648 RepID=UPI00187F0A23|nr:phage tail protein [Oculatella sp. LEGE 06141]MBE9181986.1 phage tail protein [Oculatella sp. LEGE 06141]